MSLPLLFVFEVNMDKPLAGCISRPFQPLEPLLFGFLRD